MAAARDETDSQHPASGTLSTSLLEGVQAQQSESWRRLTRLFGPQVYRWARQTGLQSSDAADVVQETFRSVLLKIAEFHRSKPGDSFRAWLWTITRNKVRDHYRRQALKPGGAGGTDAQRALAQVPELPAEEPCESAQQTTSELARGALELVRAEFEELTWRAFLGVTTTNRTSAEVAAELGMTKKAVRQAKYRVLQRIRKELDGLL